MGAPRIFFPFSIPHQAFGLRIEPPRGVLQGKPPPGGGRLITRLLVLAQGPLPYPTALRHSSSSRANDTNVFAVRKICTTRRCASPHMTASSSFTTALSVCASLITQEPSWYVQPFTEQVPLPPSTPPTLARPPEITEELGRGCTDDTRNDARADAAAVVDAAARAAAAALGVKT